MATYHLLLLCGLALILTRPLFFRKDQCLIQNLTTLAGLSLLSPGVLILLGKLNGSPRITLACEIVVIIGWLAVGLLVFRAIAKYRTSHQAP